MADVDDGARRRWLREGLLLGAFLVLIGLAAWTVALPELSDAPTREPTASTTADAGAAR
jgi:hypothetical protein